MSSCLHIRLDRGLRTFFLAALAAVAWLVLCTGTANAATAESGPILNLDSVDAASDDPLVSGLPLVQDNPTSTERITKPVTKVDDVVAPPVTEVVNVAAPPVVEAADAVPGGAQELIAGVDPLGAAIDPLAGEKLRAVDAVVAPALSAPSGHRVAAEQLTVNASGILDAAAATAPPATAASGAPYAPPTQQPAPPPFQQSANQGMSPTGSSASGGAAPPGAADIANPWPAPSPTHSGRIPVSAQQLPAAPSFDPGSRPD